MVAAYPAPLPYLLFRKRALVPLTLAGCLVSAIASAQVGGSLPQVSENGAAPAAPPAAPPEAVPPEARPAESQEKASTDQPNEQPVVSAPAPPTTNEQAPSEQADQKPAPLNAPAPSSATAPMGAVEATENQAGPAPQDEGRSEEPASPYNTLIILESVAKYGLIGRGTDLLESDQDDPFDEKFSVAYLGLQATLGLMPARSAFTLAGRLRGGLYLGHPPAMGSMGAAMLFGANFARNENGRSFSYAMGGLGVEFLPTDSQDMLTVHASGGTVINEFTLGAGVDFGINNEVFIATFGLQVGWARLL